MFTLRMFVFLFEIIVVIIKNPRNLELSEILKVFTVQAIRKFRDRQKFKNCPPRSSCSIVKF